MGNTSEVSESPTKPEKTSKLHSVTKIPASISQQQFWLMKKLHPESSAYNIPSVFRIKGSLSAIVLEKSLNEVLRRHEVLRTTFVSEKGRLLQVIHPPSYLDLPVQDLCSENDTWQRLAREEVVFPFRLAVDLPVRVRLLKARDDEYIFIVVMHHIVTDLHSGDLFAKELDCLYRSYAEGKEPAIKTPRFQYSEFALWQRDWIKSKQCSAMSSFWKDQLEGYSGYLDFPVDHQREAVQSLRGDCRAFCLPPELTVELMHFSRREHVDIFVTLLCAYILLLHRYSTQNDIIVGVPLTNRRREEHKEIMGCFMNIAPIAVSLSERPNFKELLRQVRRAMLLAHRNQEIPFEMIVSALQPKRDISYNPLFQYGFTFEPPMQLELDSLTVEPIRISRMGSQLDMFIYIWQTGDAIRGQLEYNTGLFSDDTAERFVANYEALLSSAVQNAEICISSIPILSETERRRVLFDWNETRAEFDENLCLHQLFEAQVERTPEAAAVQYREAQFTYRALNGRANQLAHYLRAMGVGPETLVGIYMERSLEMVIALYGVLKAGGAFVPLDPEYPPERVAFMIGDTGIGVILTQEHLMAGIPDRKVRVVCLDSDWDVIAEQETGNLCSAVTAENLAYVIYTSGSTGKPKGVMNEHRGICNMLRWMQLEYRLTEEDRILQKTPFSFDVSVWEFFLPLLTGANIVMAQPGLHKDGAYLVKAIIENDITTIHFVPPMLQVFLDAKGIEQCHSLRRVICSGEALSYELQGKFFQRSNAQLHNQYGPTEAAVDVTHWTCRRESDSHIVPIGYPIANTQIYILDENLQPMPVGAFGELHIGGMQVARGYLNQPEMTREKFILDPFSSKPGSRLYKTGDICRRLPDGSIEYSHRADNQVKIRGLRIELGEIEALLAECRAVSKCVVVMQEDQGGDKLLSAYLVAEPGAVVKAAELRNYLRTKLPVYMIPQHFIELDTIPLKLNGKVDRKALPPPGKNRQLDQTYVAPGNEVEQAITSIWHELLHVEKVGVRDNFFDLGGHSLMLARMLNMLQESLNKELSIIDLFRNPTIESLAGFIAQAQNPEHIVEKAHDSARKQRTALIRQRRLAAARNKPHE